MKTHCTRTWVLLRKDAADMVKNPNMLLMLLLPLLFAWIYTFIGAETGDGMPPVMVLTISTLMALALVPLSLLSSAIAEEKEKNTLRTLMLTGVTAGEFLTAKVLATKLAMAAVGAGVFLVAGAPLPVLIPYLAAILLGGLPLLLLGAVIGIASRDQMSTGIAAAPLALLMMIPTIFSAVGGVMGWIAKLTPTTAVLELVYAAMGLQEQSVAYSVAVLVVWSVLTAAAFALIYKKKRLDN